MKARPMSRPNSRPNSSHSPISRAFGAARKIGGIVQGLRRRGPAEEGRDPYMEQLDKTDVKSARALPGGKTPLGMLLEKGGRTYRSKMLELLERHQQVIKLRAVKGVEELIESCYVLGLDPNQVINLLKNENFSAGELVKLLKQMKEHAQQIHQGNQGQIWKFGKNLSSGLAEQFRNRAFKKQQLYAAAQQLQNQLQQMQMQRQQG